MAHGSVLAAGTTMTTSTNTTRMTAAIAPNFTQRGIPGYVAAPLLRELAPDSSEGRADDGDSLTAFPSTRFDFIETQCLYTI